MLGKTASQPNPQAIRLDTTLSAAIRKNIEWQAGERLEIIPSWSMTVTTYILEAAITVVVILFLISAFE